MAQPGERVDRVQLDPGAGIAEQVLQELPTGRGRGQAGERAGGVRAHVLVLVEQGVDQRQHARGIMDAAERLGRLATVDVDTLAEHAGERPANLRYAILRCAIDGGRGRGNLRTARRAGFGGGLDRIVP